MKKSSITAFLGGAALVATSPAAATSYVASFTGTFGSGPAFSGKVTFDTDRTFNGNNWSIEDFTLSSPEFKPIFGSSTLRYGIELGYGDYEIYAGTSVGSYSTPYGYDWIGFGLAPYTGFSDYFQFWVNYAPGSLSLPLTSVPASTLITASGASYDFSTYVSGSSTGGTIHSFNIAPASAVPEPTGWTMLILGMGGAGAVLRRRRTREALKLA